MTLGIMATDVEQRIDFEAMRKYKLSRLQEKMEKHDLGAILCYDPDNMRYITGANLAEWSRDKFVRYCVLPRDGDPVLFELGSAGDAKKELCPWLKPENIRPAVPWNRGANSPSATDMLLKVNVAGVKAVLEENKVAKMPLGIDIADLYILKALGNAGLNVVNGWDIMWDARIIKSPQELEILELSASLADGCYEHICDLIKPGVKESEIVGEIYGWLIKHGCERLSGVNCISGPRSNPNPHDFSDRLIRPGELVFIDIMSSYLGYNTCYYRTFVTTRATQRQKDVYKKALDWLQPAIDIVKPGITTADIAGKWPTGPEMGYPDEKSALGACVGHGIGLSIHEMPFITRFFSMDNPTPIEAGMHFAVETFAGEGEDGARIECQLIVTENGHKVITQWPYDELMVCSPR